MGAFTSSLRGAAPAPAPGSTNQQQQLGGGIAEPTAQASHRSTRRARRRAPPSLLDGTLPEDLVLLILEKLSLDQRHYGPAQACKQLHTLCHTPQLLRTVSVNLGAETLPSFYAWLLRRAAPHIHCLSMHTCTLLAGQGHDEECQAHQLIGACLAALSSATGLQQLSLHNCFSGTFSTAGWPAGLRSLRRLEIDCPSRLLLDGPPGIEQLTGLQELSVSAQWMELSPEDLPSSLTRVTWQGDLQVVPPMHLTVLTSLQSLTLRDCNYVAEPDQELVDSFPNTVGSLSAATLRHACFDETELPRTVSALTRLEAFHFCCTEAQHEAAADLLAAVLPNLRRLTALALIGVPLHGQVMRALGSLPQLQRLAYCDAADEGHAPSDLPVGPWLSRLTLLGMETVALAWQPAIVGAATQLRKLCLLGPCRGMRSSLIPLLHTAGQLPHISGIELHPSWSAAPGYVQASDILSVHSLLNVEELQRAIDARIEGCVEGCHAPQPVLHRRLLPPVGAQQVLSHKPLMAQLFGPEWA